MANFIKKSIEFNKMAKAMNGMNVGLQSLLYKIENGIDDSEITDNILSIAYIARKGVLERTEQYDWSINSKIFVPTINRTSITLMYAFDQTIGRLQLLAGRFNLTEIVNNILEKGKMFYEIEKTIDYNTIKNI